MDGKRPEFGTYADAIEQLAACRYQVPEVELPPGFSFRRSQGDRKHLWDDLEDTMDGGMPSIACVASEFIVEADSARLLALRLQTLVETTTIRGLQIECGVSSYEAILFASPAAPAITRLTLNCSDDDSAYRAVVTLAASPMARTLTRLDLNCTPMGRATANVLAAAPFDALRRFELRQGSNSPEDYRRLMGAPWFRRLERLVTHVPPGAASRMSLPALHSLCLWIPQDGEIKAFARRAELPALRRLMIHAANLRGMRAKALVGLRCGELVELWVRNSAVRPADLSVLLAAPWAKRLEVLTFEHDEIDPCIQADIDESPCAKTLRIRRIALRRSRLLA